MGKCVKILMVKAMHGSRLREARGCVETTKVQTGKKPENIDDIETTIVAIKGISN